MGSLPESLPQGLLVGKLLVGGLGVQRRLNVETLSTIFQGIALPSARRLFSLGRKAKVHTYKGQGWYEGQHDLHDGELAVAGLRDSRAAGHGGAGSLAGEDTVRYVYICICMCVYIHIHIYIYIYIERERERDRHT